MSLLSLDIHLPLKHFTLNVCHDISLLGITAVFGYSGAGKTSLLRAISGLEKTTSGRISADNSTWLDSEKSTYVKVHKRRVGFVFQDNRLFEHLSVEQNLQYGIKRKNTAKIQYDDVINIANIRPLLSQMPATLSGGEQQRVAIARAVLNEPEILLLDEPFSALDLRNKASLINLLQNLNKHYQLPIIYVSHSLDDIQQLADDMLVLERGQVSRFGSTEKVIHQLNYQDIIHQQTSLSLAIDETESDKVEQYGLLALTLHSAKNTPNIYLAKPNYRLNINDNLRCYIAADDISICLTPSTDSSIVNQLTGYIDDIQLLKSKALVKVICYEQEFFMLISLFSLEKLTLQPLVNNESKPTVYIQFKASSVKTLSESFEK